MFISEWADAAQASKPLDGQPGLGGSASPPSASLAGQVISHLTQADLLFDVLNLFVIERPLDFAVEPFDPLDGFDTGFVGSVHSRVPFGSGCPAS